MTEGWAGLRKQASDSGPFREKQWQETNTAENQGWVGGGITRSHWEQGKGKKRCPPGAGEMALEQRGSKKEIP